LQQCGWNGPIRQINYTKTLKLGTVRGLHFQRKPYAEKKIVFCVKGRVCDVVVDIRSDSQTYLQYHSTELSSDNGSGLLIPEGFAHGFQALTDDVEMLYFHSENYEPKFEDGISPLDKIIDIKWPLDVINLSDRDKNHSQTIKEFPKYV
jgi:dTDP-4-dehydrorhamnose 3,5-epimerase